MISGRIAGSVKFLYDITQTPSLEEMASVWRTSLRIHSRYVLQPLFRPAPRYPIATASRCTICGALTSTATACDEASDMPIAGLNLSLYGGLHEVGYDMRLAPTAHT